MKNLIKYYPRHLAVILIRIYQKTLSFDHGLFKYLFPYGYCRFQPSCSQYAIDAITRHGLAKGGAMAVWRVLRCNPWNKGGHDPVK
ncbi:MAG: membrane protein insertion efficiency factor YidD [Patescibacteria group bacterium]|jgi:hypothetical protein